MNLAVDAADFGLWIRRPPPGDVWASEKWRELFGFTPSASAGLQHHPEPHSTRTIVTALHQSTRGRNRGRRWRPVSERNFGWSCRMGPPSEGSRPWGGSSAMPHGRPALMRGACRDISARKQPEQETPPAAGDRPRRAGLGDGSARLLPGARINQPLGGILCNAQAAELFLCGDPPDLDESARPSTTSAGTTSAPAR